MCAMSTISTAPTSAAISPNRAKSIVRGYAVYPATITFGLHSRAVAATMS